MTKPKTNASLVLGTAGHIDHGKSSLVRALTGTDPDRLEEEKRRGITIQLGFAQLKLPSGRTMGVVDVPGHERFVRQMVAGATGVDVALLVVAADDGIMPQTVEHLAVLRVLGVKRLLVAMTKTDLVDDEWVEFMAGEIASYMEGTPYAGCAIVPCSSRTGTGLDELRAAIDKAAQGAGRIHDHGGMRMPIDRAFTVRGFGTVVTGTLWSGSVVAGDDLELLPSRTRSRVRSVQMHGESVEQAAAGNRVAVCLADVALEDVRPGDFLATPGTVQVSNRFDARFDYLDPFSCATVLESGARVRVAHGTREVEGRVLSLEGASEFKPGSSTLVQIRLDEGLPLTYGDRFIVRTLSPARVIGGGGVLSAHPRRRSTLNEADEKEVRALDSGDVAAAVEAYVRSSGRPVNAGEVAEGLGVPRELVSTPFNAIATARDVITMGDASNPAIATKQSVQRLGGAIEKALLAFHAANPNESGIDKATLRAKVCPETSQACFDVLVGMCPNAVAAQGKIAHKTAGAGAQMRLQAAQDALLAVYQAAGIWPAGAQDSIASAELDAKTGQKALGELERAGKIVRYAPDSYMEAAALESLKQATRAWLEAHGTATASELKEAMGTTRKYAMPLLEYFDQCGLTRRDGDVRTLCSQK